MNNNQGSMWQKWDFHVHTPYSLLRNGYGKDPFQCSEEDLESLFDEYVTNLFTKAVEKDIVAIGITDYFMLEGYKKIKEDYLSKPEKMIELFPDESVRKKIEKIYIFPNVELRLDTFVVKDQERNSINYHVIFSGDIPTKDIEENFLHRIEFEYDSGDKRPLTLANIEQMGAMVKTNEQRTGTDIFVGLNHITVNYSQIGQLLQTNDKFAANSFIAVPVDEDLSDIPWSGRDYATRKNIYKQSHFLMTSFRKTIDWGVARNVPSDRQKQEIESRIREFGSLKPCLWGSDAHSYTEMFNPSENRFCWIKADNTFDGLRQVVYEPADRIFIGPEHPDLKDSHYVIKSVKFNDEKFQQEEIVFNPNLNCIIGGKSTGKTLLLQNMAKAIDPSHVDQQIKSLQGNRTPLDVNSPIVTWMDGTSDVRKIVYIPQTFLNHSVEDDEGFSAKNEIIGDFLLQNPEIAQLHDKFDGNLSEIHTKTQDAIRSYFRNLRAIKKIDEELLKDGSESTFISLIKELNAKKDSLAEGADFPQEKWDQFSKLNNDFDEILKKETMLQLEEVMLGQIDNPKVLIPGITRRTSEGYENDFSQYPLFKEQLSSLIDQYEKTICSDWVSEIEKIKTSIANQKQQLDEKKKKIDADLSPLRQQSEKNKELHSVLEQIKTENKKLEVSKERSLRRKEYFDELMKSKSIILESTTSFRKEYSNYVTAIKAVKMNKDSSLKIQINYDFRKDGFNQFLESAFLKKMQEKTRNVIDFDFFSWTSENYNEENIKKIFDFIEKDFVEPPDFIRKGNQYENILLQFFTNWFHIQYDVCLDGDSINQMSPGKKAAVYLELLIGLTDVKCPILIDQPEDDLDNRSIYHDLVEYIKIKKKERQIIIVTHNANLVLGADAEEVIIANKSVRETSNKSFEYRSGSIENNIADNASNNVLYKKGIQDQICDILEGGKTAFEHRKNKYLSIAD